MKKRRLILLLSGFLLFVAGVFGYKHISVDDILHSDAWNIYKDGLNDYRWPILTVFIILLIIIALSTDNTDHHDNHHDDDERRLIPVKVKSHYNNRQW